MPNKGKLLLWVDFHVPQVKLRHKGTELPRPRFVEFVSSPSKLIRIT